MNPKILELLDRIRRMEEEIEREIARRREELRVDFAGRRVRFEREVLAQQRRFRLGLVAFVAGAELRNVVTAPVIFSLAVPFVLLDAAVTLYQWTCFPLYRIPRVPRRDYLVFDRAHLAYLNAIEKLNCAYCSYANGVVAYVREVAARTEQYWCPIKHARRLLHAHPHYAGFADFGDGEAYRRELRSLREELQRLATADDR